MLRYTIERFLYLIPTLLVMSLIVFLIMHATPGSPLDPMAANANPLTAEAQKRLYEAYGLDKPLYEQYGIYIWKVIHLDFGVSYVQRDREVSAIIANTFPISLTLGFIAFVVSIVFGLALGIIAAMRQNTWIDYLSSTIAMLTVSTPNFVIGITLIVIFSITLQWLPIAMSVSGDFDFWSLEYWAKNWQFWVLPTTVLAFFELATIARYTRASMIEVIRSDFVRTARAKGLLEGAVVMRHVLKNALIPVATILGPLFAAIGTGTFVVETLFSIPGMGKFFVTSMTGRDYNMIMAVILIYGAFLAVMNILVDLVYGFLDPRIRYN
ncbi:MAG: ABC transporter permease [Chloroflexi bacterium]|nr:ABC transporter permease [Chloroflexota bacterium]